MNNDWQALAAGAVVALTALVFLLRLARRPRHPRGGCGGNCSCRATGKPGKSGGGNR